MLPACLAPLRHVLSATLFLTVLLLWLKDLSKPVVKHLPPMPIVNFGWQDLLPDVPDLPEPTPPTLPTAHRSASCTRQRQLSTASNNGTTVVSSAHCKPGAQSRVQTCPLLPQEAVAALLQLPGSFVDDVSHMPGQDPAGAQVSKRVRMLHRMFQRKLMLPMEELQNSIAHAGDPSRLHRVLLKLMHGEPISISMLGGSVTLGVGAGKHNPQKRMYSFAANFVNWINTTFPHPGHKYHNGAMGAAPSAYVSHCIQDSVPDDVDLIIAEYTFNDFQTDTKTGDHNMNNDARRGFEVLLRKLLSFERDPAIVVLHWWTPTIEFLESAEDEMDVVAKYYRLPALSWRNAMYTNIVNNVSGYGSQEVYYDNVHPNRLGHRMLADMVIQYLQAEMAVALYIEDQLTPAEAKQKLPDPMFPQNFESNSKCLKDEPFRKVVSEADGFKWIDEGRGGNHKWGYVSNSIGDTMTMQVNTKTSDNVEDVVVAVGILKSYKHMGVAEMRCTSGCKCEPLKLDGLITDHFSQQFWVYHTASQHEKCEMIITNLPETRSGEHKVKVTSLLITYMHNDAASEVLTRFSCLENRKSDVDVKCWKEPRNN